ncbi:hypothetical protein IWW34DRAFT_855156 [Fusarium oxysporum f. sp. albedinis]|nr:hypothetical protein IWW34DRAFT_857036 [Fusarium oxysporum f. sp. albedinis]KAI3574113.1 hypothetical protein IWW34DRAFT_855156 [Fusarium oxysporum f. sp. albedinis]
MTLDVKQQDAANVVWAAEAAEVGLCLIAFDLWAALLIASYTQSPSSFQHTNQIVTLTGPKSWILNETVEVLSRAAVKDTFGSEELATTWATAWEAIRAGETDAVTKTLGEILGREPEPFEKTIEEVAKS